MPSVILSSENSESFSMDEKEKAQIMADNNKSSPNP